MFFSCFSARRRSQASTSDYVHSPKAPDISAWTVTATEPLPGFAADMIANRRASKWEDSQPEAGGTRSSASRIAGRRPTDMDELPSNTSAPPPTDSGGSREASMSNIAAASTFTADRRKMRNNVEISQESYAPLNISSRTFAFDELAAATRNFSPECFLGEGGFACVYKGCLQDGQVVAVKLMHKNGSGHRQFIVEALILSHLDHPNLVNLIGYCPDSDRQLLVYEYMPLGSLEDHLHDLPLDREPLDWNTRMKIAVGAAKGLEYLHDEANPPVIYRDFKPSNILLVGEYHPKLSDFGLAKHAPTGGKSHVTTNIRGTAGFCAPEYVMSGHLTKKSDIYSFGVVLLELITGRKVVDSTRPPGEQHLVEWAKPLFRDRRKFIKLADPRLRSQFPEGVLYGALAVAAMCLQGDAAARPPIGDVVIALSPLADKAYNPNPNAKYDTRVKEVGGSGLKWDLEGPEGEDSPGDTASALHGSLEKEDSPRDTPKMFHRNADIESNIAEAEIGG